MEKVVFVKCRLSQSHFPKECVFHISAQPSDVSGVAPIHYCYTHDKKKIGADLNQSDARIVGILIGETATRVPKVYLPDGEVYEMTNDRFEFAEV